MKGKLGKGQSGFTLIELMIVVAIVGVLAILAGLGVRKYIANAKTAEATNALGQIAKDATAAYEREGMTSNILTIKTSSNVSRHLCGSASVTVPSSTAAISGRKYQSKTSEWNVDAAGNSGFACLKFSMDAPQYYMYSYGITGSGSNAGDAFTASAQGDLNGDGTLSLFQVTGTISTSFALNVAPNLLIVRPEE